MKLCLNGLVLNAEEKTGNPFVWSGSSDELLKSLKTGIYHLEALAVDKNGLSTSGEINIAVGNASHSTMGNWKDEIHQVVLNEGEIFRGEDIRDFPRLECYLNLAEDGTLALIRGIPGNNEGEIWGTIGKADRPKIQPVPYHFYTVLENGQLRIYREKPGPPKVKIFETPEVSAPGPYKLGITTSKKLVVFRGEGRRSEIVWMSNN